MAIRCLGVVGIVHESGTTSLSPSQRRIIAILVAAGPDGITSETFADELWLEDFPTDWESAVRMAITRMRRALPQGAIVRESGRYRLELDATEVDIWQLVQAAKSDASRPTVSGLEELIDGEPFADLEPSPLLRSATENVMTARIEIIERVRGASAPASVLRAARSLVRRHPYREDLLRSVVHLHLDAGHSAHANTLIDEAIDYFEQTMGVPLSADVRAMRQHVDQSEPPSPLDGAPPEPVLRGLIEPGIDAEAVARPQIGSAIVAAIDRDRGVVIEGDSGAGKTVVAHALLATLMRAGHHIVWTAGRRGTRSAYEAILTAMPELREPLEPLFEGRNGHLVRARCWNRAVEKMRAQLRGATTVVVVDDAQWLDSHSQEFLEFLASGRLEFNLSLVVIGRVDEAGLDWRAFRATLRRSGITTVAIDPFTESELVELVGRIHRDSTSRQRRDLALQLIDQKASLPVIARELVQAAEPGTLTLPSFEHSEALSSVWLDRIDADARKVAGTAAVIGVRFRLGDVGTLTGQTVDETIDAIDRLLDARLVIAEERPDEFSFIHEHVRVAFESALARTDRRRLRRKAADLALSSGDLHSRAQHLLGAAPLVSNDLVLEALLTSAEHYSLHGSFREAVATYAQARTIATSDLEASDLVNFALAVDRSGGDGWHLRRAAFDAALISGSATVALDIALTGSLETEDAMGNPDRVRMLEQVPGRRLSAEQRVLRSAAMARELGLLGDRDRALAISVAATHDANSLEDKFRAWLGGWTSCRALPPQSWPELPEGLGSFRSPELQARFFQIRCVRSLMLGESEAGRRHLDRFCDAEFTKNDPLRRWHSKLLVATMAFVDGRWSVYPELADAAFEAAFETGIGPAFSARAAQFFVGEWMCGRHGALLPILQEAPPDLQHSLLAQSARTISLAEHAGRDAEVREATVGLAARISKARSMFSAGAAALLASAPNAALTPDSRRALLDVLRPFDGTALLVGAGFAHLGPACWSLANLMRDGHERERLLHQSVEEADRWHLDVWSLRCRLDLATATGSKAVLTEATALADQLECGHELMDSASVTANTDT